MKLKSFTDCLFDKEWSCSKIFKFADVLLQRIVIGGEQWINFFYLFFFNIEHATPDGRKQPFMQTARKIIATEIRNFETKMRKTVSSINDHFNSSFVSFIRNFS